MDQEEQRINSPPGVRIMLCEEINQEIHMLGDFVAVVWKLSPTSRQIREPGGTLINMTRWERVGHPWIDFVRMRQFPDGEVFRDEVDSVKGGLALDAAYKVQGELASALAYLEKIRENSLEHPPQIITA